MQNWVETTSAHPPISLWRRNASPLFPLTFCPKFLLTHLCKRSLSPNIILFNHYYLVYKRIHYYVCYSQERR